MINTSYLFNLRKPTINDPLRLLMSSCLTGIKCGWDGTANGEYPAALKFLKYKNVKIYTFCPEEYSFGSPREMCDIYGGNGLDVLNGIAKVLTPSGQDWTAGMIKASEKMLELAVYNKIELAIMMDISAACGSQVIYDGNRFAENKIYQIGSGVCAAQLMRNGFNVISQRDFASLEIVYSKIDPNHMINPDAINHHQTKWFQSYFNKERF